MKKKPKVLVVGSFVMDQIITTPVFPQPGQTVLGTDFYVAPGGKGANQAVQVARLGAEVTMFGRLGRDKNGDAMLNTCKSAGIDISPVLRDETLPSGCSVIVLEKGASGAVQNQIIVYPGANMNTKPGDLTFLKEHIGEYDLLLLQLEIPMAINELAAQYAHEHGVPVMLNPAPWAPLSDAFFSHLTFISPNETEAEGLTGVRIRRDGQTVNVQDAEKAARVLLSRGVKNVLITLGSAGAILVNQEVCLISPSVKAVTPVDPTAAGDSFVGAFCFATCSGLPWKEALSFSNHAAALTVSKMGAMPALPSFAEVEAFLSRA